MIYYFKAIKSHVDTKAKNTLASFIRRSLSRRPPRLGPELPLPYVTLKGILILLTEVGEGNNGKDKNSNYDFFSGFSMTDCMINDTFGSQLFFKMSEVIPSAPNRLA